MLSMPGTQASVGGGRGVAAGSVVRPPGRARGRLAVAAIAVPLEPEELHRRAPGRRRAAPAREAREGAPAAEQPAAAAAAQAAGPGRRKPEHGGIQTSLFAPFDGLPPDGRSVVEKEETCDPEERRCKTPVHVWEAACTACYGTGQTAPRGRRSGRGGGSSSRCLHTCLTCHGLGFVRKASAAVVPDLSNGAAFTLGRSVDASNAPKQPP